MKCPKCGKEMRSKNISGKSYYVCDDCRIKIEDHSDRENTYEELPAKKKMGKGKIVLICVIAFFAIGLIAAAIQQAQKPKETQSAIKESGSTEEGSAGESMAETEPETEAPQELTVSVGQTIVTDKMEIAINKVELTYDVLPDDTSGYYNHYPAESGNVYLHLDCDIKNLQKQDLPCDEILTATADYNNGYTYSGQPIVEDSSSRFTYANITAISPLETKGVHYIFSCPQEVEQTSNPLSVTITPAGTSDDYILTVR